MFFRSLTGMMFGDRHGFASYVAEFRFLAEFIRPVSAPQPEARSDACFPILPGAPTIRPRQPPGSYG